MFVSQDFQTSPLFLFYWSIYHFPSFQTRRWTSVNFTGKSRSLKVSATATSSLCSRFARHRRRSTSSPSWWRKAACWTSWEVNLRVPLLPSSVRTNDSNRPHQGWKLKPRSLLGVCFFFFFFRFRGAKPGRHIPHRYGRPGGWWDVVPGREEQHPQRSGGSKRPGRRRKHL